MTKAERKEYNAKYYKKNKWWITYYKSEKYNDDADYRERAKASSKRRSKKLAKRKGKKNV